MPSPPDPNVPLVEPPQTCPTPAPTVEADSRVLPAWDPLIPDATLSFRLNKQEDVPEPSPRIAVSKAYTLGPMVARGGMGQIFSASDPVLGREVAVKVNTVVDQGEDALFLREAQVLAQLAHPNIVPVHDFGRNEDGQPFYSMKLVRGQTFKAVLEEIRQGRSSLQPANLILIFRKICDAVAFAHSRGFLHRDLKPENVMLGEYGEVLVMDWGLALQLDEKGQAPGITEGDTPLIEGTPQFMAPEQAEGSPLDVRSDVYGLGGVLYAILTFQMPATGNSLAEILAKVRRGEVCGRDPQAKPVAQPVPAGLRALIAKATALSPASRYPNVPSLISDLDAYLAGFATQAENAGLVRQLLLLMRRHRIAAALTGVLLLTALGFTLRLAASQRQSERYADQALEQSVLARANEQTARKSAAEALLTLAELAEKGGHGGEVGQALARVPEEFRNQQWRYLQAQLDTSDQTFRTENPKKLWIACAADASEPHHLLALEQGGRIASLDLVTGNQKSLFSVPPREMENFLCASPDGSRFVLIRKLKPASKLNFFRIEMYDRRTGLQTWQFDTEKNSEDRRTPTLIFDPSGSALVVSSLAGGGILLLDAWTGALLWEAPEEQRSTALFDPKTSQVCTYSTSRGYSRREMWSGTILHHDPSQKLPFGNLSGQKVCSDSISGNLFLQHGGAIQRMDLHSTKINSAITLPGGAHFTGDFEYLPSRDILVLLVRDSDASSTLQFWNHKKGALIRDILGPVSIGSSTTARLCATPIPGQVALLQGPQIKTWTFSRVTSEWSAQIEPDDFSDAFAFLKDPDSAAAIFRGGNGSVWHSELGILDIRPTAPVGLARKSLSTSRDKNNARGVLAANRDGSLLSTVSYVPDRNIFLLKLFSAHNTQSPGPELALPEWSFGNAHPNPAGTRIWLGTSVWDFSTGQSRKMDRQNLVSPPEKARAPRWLDDTHLLEIVMSLKPSDNPTQTAPSAQERSIVLWDVESGSRVSTMNAAAARCLSPSPDGRQFAEGGSDRHVRVRDGSSLRILKEIRVHDAPVTAVAWHPQLPILATASVDRTVRIWNLQTEEKLEEFGVFDRLPDRLYWDPSGKRLAVVSRDGQATLDILRPKASLSAGP